MLDSTATALRHGRGDVGRTARRLLAPVLVLMVALTLAAAALFASGARTAWAHSGLAAASPGPGAVVGGEIDVVQLFYGDLILDFEATLTSPSGELVEAESVMLTEITAELRLTEPLSEPGEYALRHTILSFDDDVVEAAYLFTYEPDADPPILIFIDEEGEDDDGGWAWWIWAIIGLGVFVIVVLTVRLLLAIRRARDAALATAPTDD